MEIQGFQPWEPTCVRIIWSNVRRHRMYYIDINWICYTYVWHFHYHCISVHLSAITSCTCTMLHPYIAFQEMHSKMLLWRVLYWWHFLFPFLVYFSSMSTMWISSQCILQCISFIWKTTKCISSIWKTIKCISIQCAHTKCAHTKQHLGMHFLKYNVWMKHCASTGCYCT